MSDEKSDDPIGRRGFLKRAVDIGISAVVLGAVEPFFVSVEEPFQKPISDGVRYLANDVLGFEPIYSSKIQMLVKQLLFGSGDDISIVHSENNMNSLVGGITGPTKFLSDHLKGIIANAADRFVGAKDLRIRDLHGNILCLGGPIANPISRKVMGLNGVSELINGKLDGFDIHFPFHLDHDLSVASMQKGVFRIENGDASDISTKVVA